MTDASKTPKTDEVCSKHIVSLLDYQKPELIERDIALTDLCHRLEYDLADADLRNEKDTAMLIRVAKERDALTRQRDGLVKAGAMLMARIKEQYPTRFNGLFMHGGAACSDYEDAWIMMHRALAAAKEQR